MLWLTLLACNGKTTDTEAVDKPLMWPFPSAHLIVDGRVAIPDGAVPDAETPFPVDRVNWREGFSVVQTAIIAPGVSIDPATLPGYDDVGTPGDVLMWDLTDGAPIRCFAELDAYPDQEAPTLIVRPLEPMSAGHRVAVVVTEAVMPAPDWFSALLNDEPVTQDGEILGDEWAAHYRALVVDLEAAGLSDIALAFDFPTSDATAPTRAIVDAVGIPDAWDLDVETEELPPDTWMQLSGTFTVDSWLEDDDDFIIDADGIPEPQGSAEAKLFIHVPDSARDAAEGTVPVWQFGHGIFSRPEDYLEDPDDPSGVVELANRAGAILIGTVWRGLTTTDLITPVTVGADPGQFPSLTDKLAQGVANNVALSRLILEGELLDDPALLGLPDGTALNYYGISLGGIEGSTLLALNDRIGHGVAHVPGSAWSTMLERSSNWSQFEPMIMDNLTEPPDRQLLYAVSQLLWDPVDPASYVDELKGRSLLLQLSVGDEQVPNITTELMARGMGAVQHEPYAYAIEGLEAASGPLSGPAISQFDPQTARPPETNRPAPVTGAHGAPRVWDGAKLQTMRFLDVDDPGVVEHFCGEWVCAAGNTGE